MCFDVRDIINLYKVDVKDFVILILYICKF